MRILPQQYFEASRDRLGDAVQLQQQKRFGAATYLAGVAAECMLRAYIPICAPFDEKHDIRKLANAGFLDNLNEKQRRDMGLVLSELYVRWNNVQRYLSDERMLRFVRSKPVLRKVQGDPVKENCRQLLNAAAALVEMGTVRWKLSSKKK